MKRKLILFILILILAGGAVVYYHFPLRSHGMMLTGIVTTHEVNVSSQVQGRLAQLLVKEGDAVKSGQLIALIAPQQFQADMAFYSHSEEGASAQVQEAEAALKFQQEQTRNQIWQAEAALSAMEAQQAQAVANLNLARVELERTEGLYKQQVASAQALDQARAVFEVQKANVEALRKQVDAQMAQLALARSNEEQVIVRQKQLLAGRHQLAAAGAQTSKAQVLLDYTEIHAPIDGVVSTLAARLGEVVNISQPIATLINPDDLWVRMDIEETYVDRIRLGDQFTVRFPSGMERLGTVYFRSVDADFATQRDVSRSKRDIKTFEIRLRMDNKDRRFWPGLTAYVTLPSQVVR